MIVAHLRGSTKVKKAFNCHNYFHAYFRAIPLDGIDCVHATLFFLNVFSYTPKTVWCRFNMSYFGQCFPCVLIIKVGTLTGQTGGRTPTNAMSPSVDTKMIVSPITKFACKTRSCKWCLAPHMKHPNVNHAPAPPMMTLRRKLHHENLAVIRPLVRLAAAWGHLTTLLHGATTSYWW